MLKWWRERSRRQRAEAERRLEKHRANIRLMHDRVAQMDRQKRDLFHSLGFDLSDDSQSWLRQAQLMREHHDRIAEMEARIERLEGKRGRID